MTYVSAQLSIILRQPHRNILLVHDLYPKEPTYIAAQFWYETHRPSCIEGASNSNNIWCIVLVAVLQVPKFLISDGAEGRFKRPNQRL